MIKMRPAFLSLVLISILGIASCAGPLAVTYTPIKKDQLKLKEPVSVKVGDILDERVAAKDASSNPRRIGTITVTVFDMHSGDIVLSEDIPALVSKALKEELNLAGYTVKEGEDGEADFVVTGAVTDFRLDIGARDEIAVATGIKFSDKLSGTAVWTGEAKEEGTRFAGVTGNSRKSISDYISFTLSRALRDALAEAGSELIKAKSGAGQRQGKGSFAVSSEPAGARLYINDVYYGPTPANIEMDQGVYELILKKEGYKDYGVRFAVVKGRPTVLEAILEKE
ncbi:MAG: PEGA domain-containing protein [Deltaproteobacteria bacterium]|nr:PEGA domain-containing protein [Deltaproteobacteria bacterium]